MSCIDDQQAGHSLSCLNPRGVRPRIKWTDTKRELLCVLVKCYNIDWSKFTSIYNIVFAENLLDEGFTTGAGSRPMRAQFYDLKHKKHWTWANINKDHPSTWSIYGWIVLEIESVCRNSNIELIPKEDVDFQRIRELAKRHLHLNHEHPAKRRKTSTAAPSRGASLLPDNVLKNVLKLSRSAPLQKSRPNVLSGNVTTSVQQRPRSPPRLLFRFWNSKSGGYNSFSSFVAGLWVNEPSSIPNPQTHDPRIFDHLVRSHLSRIQLPSPFISTTTSPLGALHRALKAKKSYVSVLDTTNMDHNRIFYAYDLIKGNPIKYANGKKYVASGEWLLWGEIPASAIVGTLSTDALFSISKKHQDIENLLQLKTIQGFRFNRRPLTKRLASRKLKANRRTGNLIGRLFDTLSLPNRHVDELAVIYAKRWYLRTEGRGYQSYLRGVHESYKSHNKGHGEPLEVANICEREQNTALNITQNYNNRRQEDAAIPMYFDAFSLERARINRIMAGNEHSVVSSRYPVWPPGRR